MSKNFRDEFPIFTADRRGIDFRDTPEKRARHEREARELSTAQAYWDDFHARVRNAHGEGVLRRLIDMHRPKVRWVDEIPECKYCTSEDPYGHSLPRWPCPEFRVIAEGVSVELPSVDPD